MDKWYPKRPRGDRFIDAISLARAQDPAAVPMLAAYAADAAQSKRVREGTAFFGEFRGEQTAAALIRTLNDPDPPMRAEAARRFPG